MLNACPEEERREPRRLSPTRSRPGEYEEEGEYERRPGRPLLRHDEEEEEDYERPRRRRPAHEDEGEEEYEQINLFD